MDILFIYSTHINLGPLHHLTNLCQEIVKDNKKEYIRKYDLQKRFDKLISQNSATVVNFRSKQEMKARLTLDVWKAK